MDQENTQSQAANTQPEVSGNQAQGKTFTQEEVNNIVRERLARERAKAEPSQPDQREQDLTARENALVCREYIAEKKYPKELLEFFPTDNAEQFKASVEKLLKTFPSLRPGAPRIVAPTGMRVCSAGEHGTGGVSDWSIADAFKPKGR